MQVTQIISVQFVADLEAAVDWYSALFGRQPDSRPMPPSAEWYFDADRGVQLYDDPERAGGHDVIVGVPDVDDALREVAGRGIDGEAFTVPSGQFRLAILRDPSANTVILATALSGSA
ncbi:VOC family protein [Gordonia soli]|uniref:VOC domain-containing protein n=1 Tax=Gordonia soli NBRC 108243 TaxID=1223545 RepID=M0QN23_9ACTN|nr:VOC family protein [Gordonia soli]GAC70065.1 hypothetical protein GS4_32_00090 [Gordonia soli NBRC 108243]